MEAVRLDVAVFPPPAAPWDAQSPRLIVAWPPLGHIYEPRRGVSLEISFATLGDVPNGALVRVELGQHQSVFLPADMVSVVLDSVEPATHVIAFTVVADRGSNDAVPVALGPRVEISFDAVLSDANVASNRYAPDASAPLAPRAAVPPRIAHDLIDVVPRIAHDLIDVVFVGSLKWDGQKTIWLQQLRGLDRARFRLCYVSFLGAADAEAGATFAAALEAAGVQLLLEPIPSIAVVELDAALGGGAALSETYDGEQATLDAYLLDRLAAAGNVVARVSPEWARRTWEHLVGVFRHVAPDVVVFANARDSSDSLLTAAARAGAPRAKLVMELPNLFPHAPAPACVVADVLVAPSHYAATHASVADALAASGFAAGSEPPVVVVNPGVDAATFSRAAVGTHAACHAACRPAGAAFFDAGSGCGKPCETVGFLARLAPEKSPGLLVHAAYLISQQRPLARFLFIGDGAARKATEELANAYGMGALFHFTGAVFGDREVARHYAGMDVLVNPSLRAWSETFCIANIEAMALGVPVVSFGVGGVGEYLRGGGGAKANGALVNSTAPEALADAVVELLRDAVLRRRLGANARRTVLESFHVDDQIRKYADLYTSLSEARR